MRFTKINNMVRAIFIYLLFIYLCFGVIVSTVDRVLNSTWVDYRKCVIVKFSDQSSQSGGKRKGIVIICLTLCLQLTELHMRYKFHPRNPNKKNILSASQLFSLIDMKRKFINIDNHKFHQYQ